MSVNKFFTEINKNKTQQNRNTILPSEAVNAFTARKPPPDTKNTLKNSHNVKRTTSYGNSESFNELQNEHYRNRLINSHRNGGKSRRIKTRKTRRQKNTGTRRRRRHNR